MALPKLKLHQFRTLWEKDIWQHTALKDRSLRGRAFSVLRVVSITISGLKDINVGTRAAALSYSSLLGIGPLIAIAVLVSGIILSSKSGNGKGDDMAVNALNGIISFIAPTIAEYQKTDPTLDGSGAPVAPKPELVVLINSFIAGAKSGAAGVVGILSLILIVIQLFTSVETAFNGIWGVRRGRSWLMRIVFYWTLVTLGGILFFASVTALSAGTFMSVFIGKLPFGQEIARLMAWLVPTLGIGVLVLILTAFYRYIPNTHVFWGPALVGALVVTALLYLNNYLAFLYLRKVLSYKSLYGSLGFLPILMIGLYFFWLWVLVGGQISYAIQNVHFRSSQAVWHGLSASTRESLALLVLLLIGRRFKICAPAYTASELSDRVKVPTQILNECLNRLSDIGFVLSIPPGEGKSSLEHRYQPARPLDRITLLEFKKQYESYGESTSEDALDAIDPALKFYHDRINENDLNAFSQHSIDHLIEEFTPEEIVRPVSTPPSPKHGASRVS